MATIGMLPEQRLYTPPLYIHSSRSNSPYERASSSQASRSFDRNATIVLVGSRGSGKRTLGFIGATHLGRRLITEDHYFEEVTGMSRKMFLSTNGNNVFLQTNVEVVRRMLQEHETGCVIECGMGSLARGSQDAIREYAKTHPVIYILRNQNRIRQLLNLSELEAKRLEQAGAIHRSCSNFEYYNLHDASCERHAGEKSQDRASPNYSSGLKDAKQDFSNFLDFITGYGIVRSSYESQFSLAAVPAERRPYTYALNIRLSHLLLEEVDLAKLDSGGGDVVEFRIDVLVPDIATVVDKQMARIRRLIGIPVIFSIESNITTDLRHLQTLLQQALRLGVEYVAVDLKREDSFIRELIQAKGMTKVIGCYTHERAIHSGWVDGSMKTAYDRATFLGCDMVKLVQIAAYKKANEECSSFLEAINSTPQPRPTLIAYNIGLNHVSHVLNKVFTPVTHSLISSICGNLDGLMTAQEAMRSLYQQKILDPLHFCIFGATVSYSLSPAMHTAAYKAYGMGHDMRPLQAPTLTELHKLSLDPNFGGAGIAQPFKVGIMSHLHLKSHHAEAIGAVNTLIPLRSYSDVNNPDSLLEQANNRNKAGPVYAWYGDNTDWIGILICLRRNLSPRNVVQPSKTTGLVVGAGGMARASIYAMIQLGCRKIFIYNRTVGHAEEVASYFNSWAKGLGGSMGDVVTVLKSSNEQWPEGVRPATLMVSCVPAHKVGNMPAAYFEMPVQWLNSPTGGVIVELAYKPRLTPLLAQIAYLRANNAITPAWVTVEGSEFIPEQGTVQFELMTGRKAPKGIMKEELERCLQFQETLIGAIRNGRASGEKRDVGTDGREDGDWREEAREGVIREAWGGVAE